MDIFYKNLNKLAKKLGFGAVESYDKLYKTVANTYGKRNASMWFFTIGLNSDGHIVGVEVNSTYFNHTPKTELLNRVATFENPITVEHALNLLS